MGLPKAVKTGKLGSLKRSSSAKQPRRKAPARKAPARKATAPVVPARPVLGKVIHFYPKISVAIIKLASEVRQGDTISIEGHGKKFAQRVSSMQIEHAPVSVAKRGQSVGLKVAKRAKEGDVVFKA